MADAEQTQVDRTAPPKKRVRDHARDWAGMAAFVTAVAAAVGGYTNADSNEDKHKRMSRSVFNAMQSQFTLMQYRLAVVEQACGVAVPSGFAGFGAGGGVAAPAPAHAPPSAPAHARRPAAATAPEPMAEADAVEEAPPPPPEPLRKAKLTFDAIQRVVEAGEVYEPEE